MSFETKSSIRMIPYCAEDRRRHGSEGYRIVTAEVTTDYNEEKYVALGLQRGEASLEMCLTEEDAKKLAQWILGAC